MSMFAVPKHVMIDGRSLSFHGADARRSAARAKQRRQPVGRNRCRPAAGPV